MQLIGAPFVRTKQQSLECAFDVLKSRISFHDSTFADLGMHYGILELSEIERMDTYLCLRLWRWDSCNYRCS